MDEPMIMTLVCACGSTHRYEDSIGGGRNLGMIFADDVELLNRKALAMPADQYEALVQDVGNEISVFALKTHLCATIPEFRGMANYNNGSVDCITQKGNRYTVDIRDLLPAYRR